MTNVVIVHGTYGDPEGNWFPWLKQELENLNQSVIIPLFPTPEGQSLETWMRVFEECEQTLTKDSILIGHSTGATFLLSVLEALKKPVKAVFLVSAFTKFERKDPKLEENYQLNDFFVNKDFNWGKIKGNCENFYVFHGDNDPYVPLSEGKEIAEKLDAELIVISNGGHLNSEFDYEEFPELLEKVKLELK